MRLYGGFLASPSSVINSVSSPSTLSREVRQDWKFQAAKYGLGIWGTSPHQEAFSTDPELPHSDKRYYLCCYHSGIYKNFRGLFIRKRGTKTKYIFLITNHNNNRITVLLFLGPLYFFADIFLFII